MKNDFRAISAKINTNNKKPITLKSSNKNNTSDKKDNIRITVDKTKIKTQPTKLIDNRDEINIKNKNLNITKEINEKQEIDKKIENEFNPWTNEINFIQDTGSIKDFIDFCNFNSIYRFQENKKGFFENDVLLKTNENKTNIPSRLKDTENKAERKKQKDIVLLKINQNNEENVFENNLSENIKNTDRNNYQKENLTSGRNSHDKNDDEENNFLCNYFTNEIIEVYKDGENQNSKNEQLKKAENFLKTYEKYESKNKEEKKVYDEKIDKALNNLKYYEDEMNINENHKTEKNQFFHRKNSDENNKRDEVNNLLYGKNCFIDILENLNSLSLEQFRVNIFK